MNSQPILIFDASSIISLTLNGLLPELKELKKIFPGKFIIPEEVRYEVIERPLKIKRFELEAIKVEELMKEKILETPDRIGIKKSVISKKTQELLNLANKTFNETNEKPIHLIDLGETACLVLSKILNEQGIKNVLVIDERTTRSLIENPDELKRHLEKRLGTKIKIRKENLTELKGLKVIRSAELMFMAYSKGLMKIKNPRVLDAVLYGLKYKGSAISNEEIEEMKKLVRK